MMFLGLFSLLGIAIFIVCALICLLKRNGKSKRYFIFSGICLALFIFALIMDYGPSTELAADKDAATASPALDQPSLTPKAVVEKPSAPTPSPTAEATIKASATPNAAPVLKLSGDEITIDFPEERYPETAAHIAAAISAGESSVCTIDREGADANREQSLKGIATKDGYDRDEWPMAMCAEGGEGADIEYVEPSDNRGAGSWFSHQLDDYPDGTRVKVVIHGEATPKPSVESTPTATPRPTIKPVSTPKPTPEDTPQPYVYYKNCTAVRAAGADPLYVDDPGYSRKLDRDGDGVACE